METIGGRQAPLKRAAKKVLEKPVHHRVASPLPLLDHLRLTLSQASDFLRQAFVPQTPPETAGNQTCNLRCPATELALNSNGVHHRIFPQPTATSPPAPGSFFFRKNARTNMMEQSMPRTQKMSIYESAPPCRCTNS